MGAHHYSDRIHILVVLFLFFAIGTILWSYYELNFKSFTYKNIPTPTPTQFPTQSPTITPEVNPTHSLGRYCTMEAKLCSDGKTWVGRTGPNCEFAKCPRE